MRTFNFSLTFIILLTLNLTILGQVKSGVENDPSQTETEYKIQKQDEYLKSFEIVWQTINDNYFDENFGGVDWAKIKAEFEPKVKQAKTDKELYEILENMIARLKRSHFAIIPPDVFDAIEIAKTESEKLSKELGEKDSTDSGENEEDSDKVYDDILDLKPGKFGIGIDLRLIEGKLVITNLEENSAAAKKGLKTGYILEKINGVSIKEFLEIIKQTDQDLKSFEQKFAFEVIEYFLNGKENTSVQVTVINEKNEPQTHIIKRKKLSGEFVTILSNVPDQYLIFEHKSINDNVGYLKFNFFALDVVEKFCTAITDLKDKKALIIDLRGNKGGLIGSVMGISSFLAKGKTKLGTEINRKQIDVREVSPHKKTYDGKVYILIDQQSYSAAEMFAAAMKENNIATVVGQRSAGEALPSLTKPLPTGAVFQFPVANFKTPAGNYLEGVGVKPNLEISLDRESLLKGIDKQLTTTVGMADTYVSKVKPSERVSLEPPKSAIVRRTRTRRTRRTRKIHHRKALTVIDEFINKVGGAEELNSIKSYKAFGDLEIRRSGALVNGGLEIVWSAPNKYIESYVIDGAGIIRDVFDGTKSFVESDFTGADEVYNPLVLEDKSLSMGIFEILNIKNSYSRILYRGVYTIDGKEMHLIETFSQKGLNVAFLFNVESKLLYKRTSNYSGDLFFDNYKLVNDKILMPDTIRKGNIFTLKINKFTLNSKINESIFVKKENCFDKVD